MMDKLTKLLSMCWGDFYLHRRRDGTVFLQFSYRQNNCMRNGRFEGEDLEAALDQAIACIEQERDD